MEMSSYVISVTEDAPRRWTAICSTPDQEHLGVGYGFTKKTATWKAVRHCLKNERRAKRDVQQPAPPVS